MSASTDVRPELATDVAGASGCGGVSLLGGKDESGLDTMMAGGVYGLVPHAPPARFPLWALLLRGAIVQGRRVFVMLRADPEDFLQRLQVSGWPEARDAWVQRKLALFRMVDGFSKLLFRKDVDALTSELAFWGVNGNSLLLVDTADELLSLHDLSLATAQIIKFKRWSRDAGVPVLLNFGHHSNPAMAGSLNGLMDHFAGLAHVQLDASGPFLSLDYWQSPTGTTAARSLLLETVGDGYGIRMADEQPPEEVAPQPESLPSSELRRLQESALERWEEGFALDEIWARELQMLTGQPWRSADGIEALTVLGAASPAPLIVLGYGADTDLGELARQVHSLRLALPPQALVVVAEHRVSLRYTNELMLLRLGADAVVHQDLPLVQWPAVLKGLRPHPLRKLPDMDVSTALASATSSQGRGYLQVPDFVQEVRTALHRGGALDVPFALAVLRAATGLSQADVVGAGHFRRAGDFVTTDGEKICVFFNACSLTRGAEVLERTFRGKLSRCVASVDWMFTSVDIDRLLQELEQRHAEHPFDLVLQPEADAVDALPFADSEPRAVPGWAEPEAEPTVSTAPDLQADPAVADVQPAQTDVYEASGTSPSGRVATARKVTLVEPHPAQQAQDEAEAVGQVDPDVAELIRRLAGASSLPGRNPSGRP